MPSHPGADLLRNHTLRGNQIMSVRALSIAVNRQRVHLGGETGQQPTITHVIRVAKQAFATQVLFPKQI